MRNNGRLAVTARRLGCLPVGPDQMARVMFGYKANLAGGLPRRINHEFGVNQSAEAGELFCQLAAGVVIADETDKDAMRAERRCIPRHRAGASDTDDVVAD